MSIFTKIGNWLDRLEEEHNRRVATEKYEREQQARRELEENARQARLESQRIEQERKNFRREVLENKKKWHDFLKESNEQIKDLKNEISVLHDEKSALYDHKKSLHREVEDLKISRSASIACSQYDADDSFFFTKGGVSRGRYNRNHADKSRHGERAMFTKGEMDLVWEKINEAKYDIIEIKGEISANKKFIGELLSRRNEVKGILFKK